MSLFVSSLNSGSNGNCYYVGNENEAILVDAGISCREIEKRMKRLGLSIYKVKAIFISHEHSDHIKGLESLSKKYQFPVYITDKTFGNCGKLNLSKHSVTFFKPYERIVLGNISIIPFSKFHDAIDPHSFIIECNNVKVGVFTDIGSSCKHVIKNFQECHAVFLESNYDEKMLENSNYPYHLKQRISGSMGHLSNNQALSLFINYRPVFMSHLFLSHLSKNNNCPLLVKNLFETNANGIKIVIASRFEETDVYHIESSESIFKNNKPARVLPQQLALSFA